MSVEANLKLAAYFEYRARKERDEHERARLLAVAGEYRERAEAEGERQFEQAQERSPGSPGLPVVGLGPSRSGATSEDGPEPSRAR